MKSTGLAGEVKAAILLHALGSALTQEVLQRLDESQVGILTETLIRLPQVDEENQKEILAQARESLLTCSSEENSVLEGTNGFLEGYDAQMLFHVLKTEGPQLLALVAFYLGENRCRRFLELFPRSKQLLIRERMATIRPVSGLILKVLEKAILQKISTEKLKGLDTQERFRFLERLLRRTTDDTGKDILTVLEQDYPEAYRQIRALITSFEDLRHVSDAELTAALGQAERRDIVFSLKAASMELREKILRNLPQSLRSDMESEVRRIGPVALRQIEESQRRLISLLFESKERRYVESD